MKIIKIAAIAILSAFCIISCNKQEKFTNVLEIKISWIYGYWGGRGLYEYEINSNDSNRLTIHFTNGSEPKREDRRELYNKILSDNEMKCIYEFIKNFDLNKEIELNNPAWVASHSFVGTLLINIDNIVYNKEIFMGQDIKSDVYKILNYLNMFAPEEHDLPISGVNRIDIRIKE